MEEPVREALRDASPNVQVKNFDGLGDNPTQRRAIEYSTCRFGSGQRIDGNSSLGRQPAERLVRHASKGDCRQMGTVSTAPLAPPRVRQ
jgi:hypothetical protein